MNFEFDLEADTISKKYTFPSSNSIPCCSELDTLLGFTNTDYSEGSHKSEKSAMVTSNSSEL